MAILILGNIYILLRCKFTGFRPILKINAAEQVYITPNPANTPMKQKPAVLKMYYFFNSNKYDLCTQLINSKVQTKQILLFSKGEFYRSVFNSPPTLLGTRYCLPLPPKNKYPPHLNDRAELSYAHGQSSFLQIRLSHERCKS